MKEDGIMRMGVEYVGKNYSSKNQTFGRVSSHLA